MARRSVGALAAALTLLLGAPAPAAASTGGAASATGAQAVAGEVGLTITTDGAIGGVQPVIDSLTDTPLLAGQQVVLAQAGTPPEPSGSDGGSIGPSSVGQVLTLEGLTARTERVENAELVATAGLGGASVDILGISVLDVGEVSTRATTHPDQQPTAVARVERLEVFGTATDLRPGEPIEHTLELSTDQALEALTELAPPLSAVTAFAGRVAGAGGRIDVRLASDQHADDESGAAAAVGLSAQVHLTVDLRLCLPELRGEGCVGEVHLQADARVLDAQLSDTQVQRPEAQGIIERYAVPLVVLAALLASGAVYLAYRRAGRAGGRLPPSSSAE